MSDANYYERRIESLSTQVERLEASLAKARETADYWRRRFLRTDGYECNFMAYTPLQWDANGEAVSPPPIEMDEGDLEILISESVEREIAERDEYHIVASTVQHPDRASD